MFTLLRSKAASCGTLARFDEVKDKNNEVRTMIHNLQQQANQAKAAYNQKIHTFKKALSACIDTRGHSVNKRRISVCG